MVTSYDFNSNRPNNREECIVKSSKSRLELDITEKVAEDAFKWFNSISLGASPARHKFVDKSLSTYTIVNGGESFYTQKAIGLNKSPEETEPKNEEPFQTSTSSEITSTCQTQKSLTDQPSQERFNSQTENGDFTSSLSSTNSIANESSPKQPSKYFTSRKKVLKSSIENDSTLRSPQISISSNQSSTPKLTRNLDHQQEAASDKEQPSPKFLKSEVSKSPNEAYRTHFVGDNRIDQIEQTLSKSFEDSHRSDPNSTTQTATNNSNVQLQTSIFHQPLHQQQPQYPSNNDNSFNGVPTSSSTLLNSSMNQMGGTYTNGKPLPFVVRQKIIIMTNRGFKASEISKELKVSHGCISKIINKYAKTGSIMPGTIGGSKPKVATQKVINCVLKLKEENPTIFAWEIREKLLKSKVCNERNVPSVSSINRVIRQHTIDPNNKHIMHQTMTDNFRLANGRKIYPQSNLQLSSQNMDHSAAHYAQHSTPLPPVQYNCQPSMNPQTPNTSFQNSDTALTNEHPHHPDKSILNQNNVYAPQQLQPAASAASTGYKNHHHFHHLIPHHQIPHPAFAIPTATTHYFHTPAASLPPYPNNRINLSHQGMNGSGFNPITTPDNLSSFTSLKTENEIKREPKQDLIRDDLIQSQNDQIAQEKNIEFVNSDDIPHKTSPIRNFNERNPTKNTIEKNINGVDKTTQTNVNSQKLIQISNYPQNDIESESLKFSPGSSACTIKHLPPNILQPSSHFHHHYSTQPSSIVNPSSTAYIAHSGGETTYIHPAPIYHFNAPQPHLEHHHLTTTQMHPHYPQLSNHHYQITTPIAAPPTYIYDHHLHHPIAAQIDQKHHFDMPNSFEFKIENSTENKPKANRSKLISSKYDNEQFDPIENISDQENVFEENLEILAVQKEEKDKYKQNATG